MSVKPSASIAALRMRSQRITSPMSGDPAELVRWFGAIQAQDYHAALWAVGLRLNGAVVADVEKTIAARAIVRTWPMRGTIHLVPAEDAAWMLSLLAPRPAGRISARERQLELDDGVFAHSRRVVEDTLQGGKALTRDALGAELRRNGIAIANSRGLHIIARLAQDGVLCFGARAGRQPTFVLFDEWVPAKRRVRLPRAEALTELARRYFRSHGPATLKDFAWWAGLTLADAKLGLDPCISEFVQAEFNGVPHWYAEPPSNSAPGGYLLPWFDEYLVAYKDRAAVLDPAHVRKVNAGGGLLNPTLVLGGEVRGVWKRTLSKRSVEITLQPFGALTARQLAQTRLAAAAYGRFLGLPVSGI